MQRRFNVNVREVLADGLIIGMSAALLWHLSNIWCNGPHLIQEPNIVVKSIETAALLIIFLFGLNKCISDLKGKR